MKTIRDYINRIKCVQEFLEQTYNEHYNIVARELREEELEDPSKCWWENERDFHYEGFNINAICLKLFFVQNLPKKTSKLPAILKSGSILIKFSMDKMNQRSFIMCRSE